MSTECQPKGWNKHKSVVLTGAQIVTIITLIAGLIGAYSSTSKNSEEIGKNQEDINTSSQWMKDAIKAQNAQIIDLRIENASLATELKCLKENVINDEHWVRDTERKENNLK